MTLLQLITHLRESLLDDTGGTGVDWANVTEDDIDNYQLRWSNEELTRFINEAENKAASAAFLLRAAEDDFSIAVTAGTAEYSYDKRIIRLKNVELEGQGRALYPADFEQVRGIKNWRTKESHPTHYIVDENVKKIRLYPIPVEDDSLFLIYNRLPLVPHDWADPSTESEIPAEYQIDMLDYAAHMAYMKEDANVLDPQRAGMFLQKFTANFGTSSAYSEARRRKTSNRAVGYGGIPF